MVVNGGIVMSVAHVSADFSQRLRRIPLSDRINSREMLELVLCFPLRQLGRWVSWIWTYLCVPPVDYYDSYGDDDDYDDDDGDDDRGSSSSSSSSVGRYQNYVHLHLD